MKKMVREKEEEDREGMHTKVFRNARLTILRLLYETPPKLFRNDVVVEMIYIYKNDLKICSYRIDL